MYGPRGRDLVGFALICALAGALFVVGCEQAWRYVAKRVHVEWRP